MGLLFDHLPAMGNNISNDVEYLVHGLLAHKFMPRRCPLVITRMNEVF